MLQWCSIVVIDDLIALADVLPPERLRDQVDALRRVADEDDLVGVRRVQEVFDFDAAFFVSPRRLLRQQVGRPVDVRVFLGVVANQGVSMTLCGFCVVAALSR